MIALVLLLSLGQPTTAQQQELSAPLAALVRNKWEMIELETVTATDEWVGLYRAYDGPTVSTNFAWSPVSGFIVWWENCSRPTSARVNHGGAVLQNNLLKMTAEVSANTPGSFSIASEFIPVKWDKQHFLIPRDELMKFVYAVNSGSRHEVETFLHKVEDNDKKRRGFPTVPSEYARYLGMKPINAAISRIAPKAGRHSTVILNVGKNKGVIPQMKFFRFRRGAPFFIFEVLSVDEHTAEAAVVLVSGSDGKKTDPKAGWKLSSRAPKNAAQLMPF